MALGDYQLGKAPSATQVDLAPGRNAMNALFGQVALGNNRVNPMAGVLKNAGDASLGYQNAIANSRMASLGLKGQEDALAQAEKDYQYQQQQPGLTDILGSLGSGAYAIGSGIDNLDQNAQNKLLQELMGMSLPNPSMAGLPAPPNAYGLPGVPNG
jgi:hypothetical protein